MRAHRGRFTGGPALAILVLLWAITPLVAGVDADGDGFGEGDDCNDQNDQLWTVPGEALQIRFPDKNTMVWNLPADIGGTTGTMRFDTLRSTSASSFATAPPAFCLDPEGLTSSSTDPSTPTPGTVFFYLVGAKNDCGRGTLGNRSNGTPRVGVACDCSVLCSDGNACTRDFCANGACAHDTIRPAIQASPASVAACPDDDPYFTVRSSGQGVLHYQWRKGGAVIGADSSTLTLSDIGAGDNGSEITCTVTDSCASSTTAAAVLTVFGSPASCSGGGSGQEAPGGASEMAYDPPTAIRPEPNVMVVLDASRKKRDDRAGIYFFSGEFYVEETDLEIPGRGFDFRWTRKYRSRLDRLSSLGHNWDFSYNQFVAQDLPGTDLIVADGNSRRDHYQLTPVGCWAAQGFFRELCLQPDGTYVLTSPDKTTRRFAALNGSPIQGRLLEIRDRNQNVMTFSYDPGGRLSGVTDTLGRTVTVSYNAEGYISEITDFTGRQVRYHYYGPLDTGGMPGALRSVTSPSVTGTPNGNDFALGKTTSFTYSEDQPNPALNHNLLTITDPAGRVILENTYTSSLNPADPRFDRIDRQRFPNSGTGETPTVSYVYVPTADPGSDAVTKTIVNDRGNVKEVFFNALNQGVMSREFTGRAPNPALPTDDSLNRPTGQLRAIDPASFETRYAWSPDSLLTFVLFPEGNSIHYTYDSANPAVRLRANMLQAVASPGPRGGDQTEIIESWTYGTTLGDEPCACKGCCGEGGGPNDAYVLRSPDGRTLNLAAGDAMIGLGSRPTPRTQVVKKMWASYTNGRGHTSTQDIDPTTGNVLQVTAPTVTTGVLGGGTQTITESFEYNSFGQLTAHTNPTGRRDEYTYYTSGPATGYPKDVTVDALGHATLTVTARDAFGNMTARTDPNGNTETFVYNQLDQMVRHVSKSPFHYETDFCYDVNDDLVRTDVQNVDQDGVIQPNAYVSTAYRYDAAAVLVRETLDGDTLNIKTEYEHDRIGHTMLVRLPESVKGNQPANVVRERFDERGLRLKVTPMDSEVGAATTQYDYDGNGNLVAIREGLEGTPRVTTMTYDGYDRQMSKTDPMGNVTSFHYDANGNVTSTRTDGELIDGESGPNVRLYEATVISDEVNRPVRRDVAFFDPATGTLVGDGMSTTKTFYNEASQVIRTEDDNGNGTNTAYDTANRPSSTIDARGNSTTYGYDANGNILTVTESEVSDLPTPPEPFVTTNTFDHLDRLTSTTDNAGNVHQHRYDSRNNRTVHIDARGNTTRFEYDAMSRLTATRREMTDTGEGGGTLTFVLDGSRSYDDDSRVVTETDDNGHVTSYQWDPRNRLVATIRADGTSELRSYDIHGNLTGRVDANGSVTTSTYDADDRVATRTITRAPGILGTTFEIWKHDGVGHVVHAANDSSVVERRPYSIGQKIQKELVTIGPGPTRAITYSYDGAGSRVLAEYPSGLTIATTYDALRRPKTVTTGGLGVCLGGPAPGKLCGNDGDCGVGVPCTAMAPIVATYDYAGPGGRVVRSTNGNNTQTTVTYDGDRRITRTTHARLSPPTVLDDRIYAWDAMDNKTSRTEIGPPGSDSIHTYSYDSASRMAGSIWLPPGTPPVVLGYALDGVGNRTSVTGGPDAGPYSMSSLLPEPADYQVNQYTSTPFDTRAYDRNGNLVQKPATGESMSYDYRNRMVQSSGPLGAVIYEYDPFGRRIVADGKRYFFDGTQEVEGYSSAGALEDVSVPGARRFYDIILSADTDGDGVPEEARLHADDLGNVVAVTDEDGDVLESYDYDDFGKPTFFDAGGSAIPASAIDNTILFHGHRYDDDTGLYHDGASYLDPRSGRLNSIIGDWNYDGIDTVGYVPIKGDWDNDGTDTGLIHGGDWNGNGEDTGGVLYSGNNPWSNPAGRSKTTEAKVELRGIAPSGNRHGISIVLRDSDSNGKVKWFNDAKGFECIGGISAGEVRDCSPNVYRKAGGGEGGGGVIGKWECIWSGGTWIYDWSMGGFCMKPLTSALTVAGGPGGSGRITRACSYDGAGHVTNAPCVGSRPDDRGTTWLP